MIEETNEVEIHEVMTQEVNQCKHLSSVTALTEHNA